MPWCNILGALPALKSLHVQLSSAGVATPPSFHHMAGVTFLTVDFGAVARDAQPSVLHAWFIASLGLPLRPRSRYLNVSAPLATEVVQHGILGHVFTRT